MAHPSLGFYGGYDAVKKWYEGFTRHKKVLKMWWVDESFPIPNRYERWKFQSHSLHEWSWMHFEYELHNRPFPVCWSSRLIFQCPLSAHLMRFKDSVLRLQISHLRKVVGCYPSMKNLAKQPKANVKGVIASGAALWWSLAAGLGQQRSAATLGPRLWPFIGLLVVWETRPWAFGGDTWTAELMQPQGKSLRWVGLESEWLIDFECWSSPGFQPPLWLLLPTYHLQTCKAASGRIAPLQHGRCGSFEARAIRCHQRDHGGQLLFFIDRSTIGSNLHVTAGDAEQRECWSLLCFAFADECRRISRLMLDCNQKEWPVVKTCECADLKGRRLNILMSHNPTQSRGSCKSTDIVYNMVKLLPPKMLAMLFFNQG